jgi:hypothetical protein
MVLKLLKTLWIRIKFLPLRLRMDLGAVLNWLRIPGLVLPCDYKSGICKGAISVRTGVLFTVIQVNGLDIYFSRLTGKIDGVGFSQVSGCTPTQAEVSAHPDECGGNLIMSELFAENG